MTHATLDPGPEAPPVEPEADPYLVGGRPIEDRTFEIVEFAAGAAAGLMIGSAVAGPVGTVVGGVAGAAAGLLGGEVVERRAGRAATTTDAVD
jgi:outer membrane lipoprotein SlyB